VDESSAASTTLAPDPGELPEPGEPRRKLTVCALLPHWPGGPEHDAEGDTDGDGLGLVGGELHWPNPWQVGVGDGDGPH
jgi:hypothetical protein